MLYELCTQISTDTRQFIKKKKKKRRLYKTEHFNNMRMRHEKPILIFAGWMQKTNTEKQGKAVFFLILVQEPPT